jgi:hypothetical protein
VGIDAKSAEVAHVMRRSKGFVLVDNKLYRHGASSGVLMKCVTKEDGYDILREIHEGVCGNHAASRTPISGGPPRYPMRRISCAGAKIVNSSASSLMFQPTASSPYRHPGPLLAGALI